MHICTKWRPRLPNHRHASGNWLCQYHLAAIDGGIAAAPGVTRTAVLFVLFIEGRGANGLAARMLPTGKPADSSGKEMLV